ncbi:11S seed storage globulin B [Zostera marina]|uniref:11S seed storage globulin B n=1 Tax=Zostera marina TaxID=29655 RepID=A0A0K9NU94_ZOSMR|nr:11S seed storage globulin B [Zostera marina]
MCTTCTHFHKHLSCDDIISTLSTFRSSDYKSPSIWPPYSSLLSISKKAKMGKTNSSLLPLALCCTVFLLLLLPFSLASQRSSSCNIEKLKSQKPITRLESEAGVAEIWDESDCQFECAGVTPTRYTVQPKGLLLPRYSNYPTLIYVVEGEGILGAVIPGCPESFQSSRQGDEHQRVQKIRQGDIIALPAGISVWGYNTGNTNLVGVAIRDIASQSNQLDRSSRMFFLAGNEPRERSSSRRSQESRRRSSDEQSRNIFSGFDTEILSEAFGVDSETARKLQNVDQSHRGFIIKVDDFQVTMPTRVEESRRSDRSSSRSNGMEELMCNMQLVQNIDDPRRSSVIYNREAGYLSDINLNNLPILRHINLGATRGHLRRNAVFVPHFHMNSHSVLYAIRGSARIQIVNDNGDSVHDDVVEEGEFISVPQNFVVTMKAEENSFDFVAFKTSGIPMTSTLAGKTSILRGIPDDVLRSSYGLSTEEVRKLKDNREEETMLVSPGNIKSTQ